MKQKFCVIATPRTGSNWLTRTLNDHPQLACHGEVYHQKEIYNAFHWRLRQHKLRYVVLKKYRNLFPLRYLQSLLLKSAAAKPEALAIGFKLFPGHHKRVFHEVTTNPEWKIIFLTRQNRLAQYSSFKIAQETASWIQVPGWKQPEQQPKVQFDAEKFAIFSQRNAAADEFVRKAITSQRHFELDYSEIEEKMVEAIRFIHEGIDTERLQANITRKQNSENLLERFNNPQDILETLSESQHQLFLG